MDFAYYGILLWIRVVEGEDSRKSWILGFKSGF